MGAKWGKPWLGWKWAFLTFNFFAFSRPLPAMLGSQHPAIRTRLHLFFLLRVWVWMGKGPDLSRQLQALVMLRSHVSVYGEGGKCPMLLCPFRFLLLIVCVPVLCVLGTVSFVCLLVILS
eukprot:RCo017795